MEQRRYTPRSRAEAQRNFRLHIEPTLGKLCLSKITPDRVREWHSNLLRSYDDGSGSGRGAPPVRNVYNLLKAVMHTAEDRLIGRNPCRLRGASRAVSPKRPLMTYDDVLAIADKITPHLRLPITLAWFAHLRVGELIALRWSDIDLASSQVHVHRQMVQLGRELLETPPKAHSDRFVDIPLEVTDLLRSHLAASGPVLPSARVFTNSKGGVLTSNSIAQAWSTARVRADRPQFRFHDMRGGSLTLASQGGATAYETMRRAGHPDVKTHMGYQQAAAARGPLIAQAMFSSTMRPAAEQA